MQTQAFAGVQPQVTWPPLQRGSGQAAIIRAVTQQQFPNLVSWLQLLPGSVVPLHSLFPFSNVIKNQKFAHRQTDVSTRSLIKALFVVAKLGKRPKHPPIED